ncbi:lysoplasmalogenase [Flavobacterium sp.]|uniref:lysoplasmalogenase n=1 Tax=Flavobacterium sp. TaxID=239 RepID=UPI002FDA0ACB
MTSQRLLQSFLVFGIVYSLLTLFGNDAITWYLKPLLLPLLFFAVAKETFDSKKWLLSALFFSWIGDCILLFADKGELYFIFGLVSFLIAHLLFIVLFSKQQSESNHWKKPLFWIGFIGVAVYLVSMLSLLLPSLGDLKIPVSIYALTISIMLIVALKGAFNWNRNSKYWVLAGAVFFVVSDSLLAINKFHSPIPLANFWIMITYLMAQFCITYGILKLNKNALD